MGNYNKQYYISQKNAAIIGERLGYYTAENYANNVNTDGAYQEAKTKSVMKAVEYCGTGDMADITMDMVCRIARRLGYPVRRVTNQWVTNSGVVL